MNKCMDCEYKVKDPWNVGHRCMNRKSERYRQFISFDDSCDCYKAENTCQRCPYQNHPAELEPCRSCIRSHDGYKTHR